MRASARRPVVDQHAHCNTLNRIEIDHRPPRHGIVSGLQEHFTRQALIVVVQGATRARRIRGMATSRVRTTTGRRQCRPTRTTDLSADGSGLTRQPQPHGTTPDLPFVGLVDWVLVVRAVAGIQFCGTVSVRRPRRLRRSAQSLVSPCRLGERFEAVLRRRWY